MKYLCLAYEEEKVLNELSRAEWDALRGEALAYVETLRKNGHLVLTNALQSARTAATVRVRDGVLDGPYAETKEQLGGFFLIEARDREGSHRDCIPLAVCASWQYRGAAHRGRPPRRPPISREHVSCVSAIRVTIPRASAHVIQVVGANRLREPPGTP